MALRLSGLRNHVDILGSVGRVRRNLMMGKDHELQYLIDWVLAALNSGVRCFDASGDFRL